MAVDLARYVVSLEAQTATYVKELDKANKKLDRFHKDQERALGAIKKAFLSLGVTLAAALSVRAIVNFTRASVEMADRLGETARAAGISAETLQRLRFSFDQLGGIAAGETDQGLQRFNRTLGLAINGGREAQQQFKLLGVAFKDSFGRGVGTASALDATLKALGEIENDAQRAALAGQLFGREMGPKLAAALKGGSQALDEARAQVTGIISDKSVRQAEALDDGFKTLAATLGGPLKEAAIGVAFEMGKIFRIVEDAPLDVLKKRIEDAKGELEFIKKSLLAPFPLAEAVQEKQIQRARQLQENIQVLEAALAAVEKPIAVNVSGLEDLQEILPGNGKLPELPVSLQLTKINGKAIDFALNGDGLAEIVAGNGKLPEIPVAMQLETIPQSEIDALFEPIDNRSKEFAQSMGADFKDAFQSWISGADHSFSDLLRRMAANLATSAIFDSLSGFFKGSTGKAGKFFSDFFGGFRAQGGPLQQGKWYIAGERGPEPVWGGGPGAFAAAGSAGGPPIQINVTVQAGLPPQWTAQLAVAGQAAASAAYDAVMDRMGGKR